jgi:hypothetical protein
MKGFEEIAFICLVTFWWILSLLGQARTPLMSRLRSRDVFHLIPTWRFFAPAPARRDYHVEYRTMSRKGRISKYVRVPMVNDRTWLSAVWYPSKRRRKAFNTSVRRIVRCRSRFGGDAALRCVAYLHLLNHLQGLCLHTGDYALQFHIISAADFADDPRVRLVLKSDWHRLDIA